MAERWSRGVRIRPHGLGGWGDHQSPRTRRAELRKVAARDGAGTVSRRLNFLANVANRMDNERLHRVARSDQRWVEETLEESGRYGSYRDGRRPIRVRGSSRARAHRRRRARG